MTALDYATTHRTALLEIGWACGPLVTAADGSVGFTVTHPALRVGTGRKATIKPAGTHIRSFDAAGVLTVERTQP